MAVRSSRIIVEVAAAAAILMTINSVLVQVQGAGICPGNLVYPFSAQCSSPARYVYEQGVYELAGYSLQGSLAPEQRDDSNSTYSYVRLAESGAKYTFSHLTREIRPAVSQSDDVIITNLETGRGLAWRQEGEEGEYFLVEVEGGSSFQFAEYDGPVPCILPWPPVSCGVYNILNFGASLGLSPHVAQDNATYFKLSDQALASFILRSATSTASALDLLN